MVQNMPHTISWDEGDVLRVHFTQCICLILGNIKFRNMLRNHIPQPTFDFSDPSGSPQLVSLVHFGMS